MLRDTLPQELSSAKPLPTREATSEPVRPSQLRVVLVGFVPLVAAGWTDKETNKENA